MYLYLEMVQKMFIYIANNIFRTKVDTSFTIVLKSNTKCSPSREKCTLVIFLNVLVTTW